MKNQLVLSCVIPFFNESERLSQVIKVISRVKNIEQIICVDDGSKIDISSAIKKQFIKVKVIRLVQNRGKAEAIHEGLKAANGKYILLLDADLKNLKAYEVENAINIFIQNPDIDMIILRRINASFQIKLNRGDTLFSGERILKKSDLRKIIKEIRPDRFEIEIAINQFMMNNHKKVFWMSSSALNTYKIAKMGFFKGIVEDVPLILHLIRYIGIRNYLRQMFTFCKQRAI
ncbi:hypothetical protein A2Y99_01460 [Candidatus Gottesmanbacteria bacterium RBG_13_37_7]|uniref:Glycosyltransferase 2-like domain-containing protein n=1 Tax=Candidatus Gottesmanbacteria bacterium RBG_13_37_7 TaxID=1798369 RepID=A0A1F5YIQ9_9BACT|nr:MAG: hypothetical protein A2Y99_01460 [Candidatus Gottesmanbacteria bacterium RBG_13_37_7]